MKTSNKLVAFMAMAMLSVSALADKEPQQGFYISPEVNKVTHKDYCKGIRSVAPQARCSESAIGFGLLGGYKFNDFVAVEAGFHIASGFDVSATFNGVNVKSDLDYNSYSLGSAWRYPIGERFALTGTVGYHFWDVEANVSAGGAGISASRDGSDLYFGGGLEFITTDKINSRVEYTRYTLNDEDADVISFRLVVSF